MAVYRLNEGIEDLVAYKVSAGDLFDIKGGFSLPEKYPDNVRLVDIPNSNYSNLRIVGTSEEVAPIVKEIKKCKKVNLSKSDINWYKGKSKIEEDTVRKMNESFYIGWTKFDSLNDFKDAWFEHNNYDYKAWVIYKNDEGDWRLTTTYDYKHPEDATYWQVDPKIISEIKEDPDLSEIIIDESLTEDTVKKSNGKWTNRGDDGKEHGEFKTKKQADAQCKAMYANGYKGESLKENGYSDSPLELAQMSFETGQDFDRNDFRSNDQYSEYLEYMNLGPMGFYEEYKDELDFSQDFIDEYGDIGDFGYDEDFDEEESLNESYYDGKVSIDELRDAADALEALIESMEDSDIDKIQSSPNTYGIGMPFLGTRSGYVDLSDFDKYLSVEDDEDY